VTASRWRRSAAGLLLGFVATIVAAACGPSASPTSAGAMCSTDVRAGGTIPALEALLPRGMIERSPDLLDSGVNCTPASLGSYTAHGIAQLRFAGATWDQGKGNATVVAIVEAGPSGPPLQPTWVEEFYTVGAINGRHTGDVKTSRPTMPGAGQVFRLETLNDLSLQTVVVWAAGARAHVVIVATTVDPNASRADHDQRVAIAVEVAAGVAIP
jgi:hypothetical protein